MFQAISREEVEALVASKSPTLLLEILPPEYYAREHLPEALNLPLEGLDQAVQKLVPNRDTPIVTYCAGPTCANSHVAARRLIELGYRNVRAFTGGKSAWRDAGLAFQSGAPATVTTAA